MKTIFIAIIMLIAMVVRSGAQVLSEGNVVMSVTYKTEYFTVTKLKDRMALDIGNGMSHFYSADKKREQEILDSLNSAKDFNVKSLDAATGGVAGGQSWHIYKGVPEQGKLTFLDVISPDEIYRYEEDVPQIAWNLLDGDTVIVGYRCQKAEAELRGRRWTAWYSTDIPVQDGPWKLGGLPGLILKATESEGLYSFECVGIERGDGSQIEPVQGDYVDCTPTKYYGLMRRRLEDPISHLAQQGVTGLREYAAKRYGAQALRKQNVKFIEYYGNN